MIILQKLVTGLITEDKYQIYTKYTVVVIAIKKLVSSYAKAYFLLQHLKDSNNEETYIQIGFITYQDNYRQGFVLTAKAVRLYIRTRV